MADGAALPERLARRLAGLHADELVIPAAWTPYQLPNGRPVYRGLHATLTPLWQCYIDDAQRLLEAFGELACETLLLVAEARDHDPKWSFPGGG